MSTAQSPGTGPSIGRRGLLMSLGAGGIALTAAAPATAAADTTPAGQPEVWAAQFGARGSAATTTGGIAAGSPVLTVALPEGRRPTGDHPAR